jgi:hypothetical protein
MQTKTLTGQLVEQLLAVEYGALPPEAIDMAKQVTLDGLAVMFRRRTEPLGVGRISMHACVKWAAPHASVIAGGFKTSMLNAAREWQPLAHASISTTRGIR